jgi:hypothetical protein
VKAECSSDAEEFGDKAEVDWLETIDPSFQPSTQSKSITSIKLKDYIINPSVDSHEQNENEMPKEVDEGMYVITFQVFPIVVSKFIFVGETSHPSTRRRSARLQLNYDEDKEDGSDVELLSSEDFHRQMQSDSDNETMNEDDTESEQVISKFN